MAVSVLKLKPTKVKLPNGGVTLCTTSGTPKMKRCIV